MLSHLSFLALEALLPAVVLAAAAALLLRFVWKEPCGKRMLLLEVFVLFLLGVLTVTGVPSIRHLTLDATIQWVPFSQVPKGLPGSLVQPLLNAILFVPLGILLPTLWDNYRVWWRTLLFGGGLSLCIEILQLFNFRTTDVDDLLCNALGTLLGWGLFRLFSHPDRHAPAGSSKPGPLALCLLVLLLNFFVFPWLAPA